MDYLIFFYFLPTGTVQVQKNQMKKKEQRQREIMWKLQAQSYHILPELRSGFMMGVESCTRPGGDGGVTFRPLLFLTSCLVSTFFVLHIAFSPRTEHQSKHELVSGLELFFSQIKK